MKFAASHQIAVNFATVAKGRHKHREAQKNNIGLSVEMTQERDYPACKKPSVPHLFAQALIYERKING